MADRAQLDRWMTAAADGDRAAFDPLFQALWPIVVGYATRLVGSTALAEDCAQEALVRLFGQLERYDRSRDALTWVLTIATWQCRTARRSLQRRGEMAEVPTDAIADGPAILEERELVRTSLDALATLAPRDIEVITAALLDDDELRGLRRTLAPATFRKRLERAFGRLRASWRSRHGTL
jgi:RNA polymerase sigma-70 factor (ECF subfamily)